MQKKPQVLLLAFFFLPFLAWAQEEPDYWVSKPSDGALTIIGVSNRQFRREREIESARDDAARKLLFYHGVKGTVRTVAVNEPGAAGLRVNTEATLEPRFAVDFQPLREALTFDNEKDVFRTGNAVFVRFACPVLGAKAFDYVPTVFVNGEPLWTHRPAQEIAGYVTGVGFSGPQRYIKDTVSKSCENAAVALIVSMSAQMETIDRDSSGQGTVAHIVETAEGELSGFMVLEMWIDPKTKAVWTLAAAWRGY